MNRAILIAILALQLFALYYLIRSARNLGSKATKHHNELMANINLLRAGDGNNILNHLLIPNGKEFKNVSWEHVISLTSHPARFNTLHIVIEQLLNQRLIPNKIYLNIASEDMAKLPTDVSALKNNGILQINSCADLGPGKKLIPTLMLEKALPIIVVDDDLIFEADLSLKLMIQHHLTPKAIVASRVHKITYSGDEKISSYNSWHKNYSLNDGPATDLFATSGAGTLYKADFFHSDVTDEKSYKQLSFHTDDLWWFIQGRRVGTLTKRLPGISKLNYIEATQADGLWQSGNQDRNDSNLKLLLDKYSI